MHLMGNPDYKTILLQLIASLTLADHMGDVSNSMDTALRLAGVDIDWNDFSELQQSLYNLGVTTLHGTSIGE